MNVDTLIINYLNDNNKNQNIIFNYVYNHLLIEFNINEINITYIIDKDTLCCKNLDELLIIIKNMYLSFEKFVNIIYNIKNMKIEYNHNSRIYCSINNIDIYFDIRELDIVSVNGGKLSIDKLQGYLLSHGCKYKN